MPENAHLKEQLSWFHRQIFGKRSEKIVDTNKSTEQLLPFDLPSTTEVEKEKIITSHTRRQAKKNKSDKITFPENLPVKCTVIDVKEEEKVCPITNKPFENVQKLMKVY